MTMTLTDQQQAYIEAAPMLSRTIVQRALQASASPRQAIKAKCLTCCNYDRSEVAECTVAICPLWQYRPYIPKASKNEATD